MNEQEKIKQRMELYQKAGKNKVIDINPIPTKYPNSVLMALPYKNYQGVVPTVDVQPDKVQYFLNLGYKIIPKEQIAQDKAVAESLFADLHMKHKGQKGFVVGCGPSFTPQIAAALKADNAISVGVNWCFLGMGESGNIFPPRYHLHADASYGFKHRETLVKLKDHYGVEMFAANGGIVGEGFRTYDIKFEPEFKTSFDVDEGFFMYDGGTSTFLALQLAALLGLNLIILIGIDLYVPDDGPFHFYPDDPRIDTAQRKKQFKECHFPANIKKFTEVAAPALKEKGITVLNGSPKSHLDCFTKVQIESFLGW